MKNKLEELREKRNAAQEAYQNRKKELRQITDHEKRQLTASEEKDLEKLVQEIRQAQNGYESELEKAHEEMTKKAGGKKEEKRALLSNLIWKSINKRTDFTPGEAELMKEGRKAQERAGYDADGDITIPFESRAVNVGTDGDNFVQEDKFNIMAPLRSALGAVQAGATMLTGLTNNTTMPGLNAITAEWEGEGDEAQDGYNGMNKVEWKPKRLSTSITISKMAIIQDNIQTEEMLQRDIVAAVKSKLDQTIFGEHNTTTTKPDGFFTGTDTTDLPISGAVSYNKLIDMESAVGDQDAPTGKGAYVTTAKGAGALKKAKKDSGSGRYVMEKGEANDYPVIVTNNVSKTLGASNTEHGIVFSSAWEEYIIGQFGALSLTIDPYTRAKFGEVVITINAYFDAAARRPQAFSIASINVQ